ncbi:CoA-binding domain-containing protein [Fusarium keratoplasticum]|uniref:CoA-binding domain-containing protein n=1 Tax=Fusarium keratoplasticum TaxID=1328300 RepID=A0ACC0R0T9_9HYPO|nr:CoA-binding domain-containing protein [Fusarium keratoplasticum]KAI8670600.1 CoA-binding domain-containing protein [Fusarium keratoplasticum]
MFQRPHVSTSALRHLTKLSRSFSTSLPRQGPYDETIKNLELNDKSRVIFQGFTGRAATINAKDTIEYGTNVVGGVSPGKGGQTHLDLPVFNTVQEAMAEVKPHVSAVFVPAQFAAKAIIESIEAEVPLVVSVAEHVPVHDMLRVHEILRTQSKTRLVGPNCPGIIAPEQCRVGIMPYKQYTRGCVGIVSKSGTLSYEAVGSTSRAGLGQSIVVGMGGDMLPGTTLADGLKLFFEHDETRGIIVIGEIGGEAELEAAELIKEYRKTANPKPVVAMVAGRTAPEGKTMGHAGAVFSAGDITAGAKAKALEDAGAIVVPHPGVMGKKMRELLGGNVVIKPQVLLEKSQRYAVKDKEDGEGIATRILGHRTGLHPLDDSIPAVSRLYVEEAVQFDKKWHIAMTIDRENYCPVIRIKDLESCQGSPIHEEQKNPQYSFGFSLRNGISDKIIADISKTLQLPETKTETLGNILQGMFRIFSEKEAINLETHLLNIADGRLICSDSGFFFDDAAQKRQPDLFALRDSAQEVREEVEAEKYGLVYVRMDGNIGNVVNGAGLAMATNDAISLYGGSSANFLDAGGQATKETMLQAFGIIMRDERVKAILVNIYGGITRCDMIAESIIAAASELGPLCVPMVVRLQGTNSEAGLKLLSETDLGIHVEADFGEAARKAVELANQDY